LAALDKKNGYGSALFILTNTGIVTYSFEMKYTYTSNLGVSSMNGFEFTWSSDSIIFNGQNIIIGGQDLANNYSIMKFLVGSTPVPLQYSISYN
jgi:hypothetical protein